MSACRLSNCLGHPELPGGWTSWQEALHSDDSCRAFFDWHKTEPVKRAESLGHTVEWDPPFGLTSGRRWTCTRDECGRAVLINGDVIYGEAVRERCGPR